MCLMCKPTKNVKWLCSLQLKMIRTWNLFLENEEVWNVTHPSPKVPVSAVLQQYEGTNQFPFCCIGSKKQYLHSSLIYPWQERRSKSELEESRVYFLQRAIVKTKQNCCLMTECGQYSCAMQCIGAHHTVATHIRWLPRHQKKASSCWQLPQLSIKEMDWFIQRTFQFCSLLNTRFFFFRLAFPL